MSDAAREPEDDEMSQLDQAGPTEVATDVEATADDDEATAAVETDRGRRRSD